MVINAAIEWHNAVGIVERGQKLNRLKYAVEYLALFREENQRESQSEKADDA